METLDGVRLWIVMGSQDSLDSQMPVDNREGLVDEFPTFVRKDSPWPERKCHEYVCVKRVCNGHGILGFQGDGYRISCEGINDRQRVFVLHWRFWQLDKIDTECLKGVGSKDLHVWSVSPGSATFSALTGVASTNPSANVHEHSGPEVSISDRTV